jgi:gamma-glutamyltranspeptidase/glutathione hydrolase
MARGVVAAGHAVTADAADQILRAGGNAYDAVLAALAAACVAEPVLASPGGGGFLLALPAEGPSRLYDFFVHTPSARRPMADLDFYEITADFGTTTQDFHIGRGTVAVPGVVRGLFEIHRDLCRMPLREIVAPAVERARAGVLVTEFQAYLFRVVQATFLATPQCRAVFGSQHGGEGLVEAGESLRQAELADTLEILAIEGEDLFYRGEIARQIHSDMAAGGQLTADDLAAYRVERRTPLSVDYAGARIHTNPPPSSGGLLIAFALGLLEATPQPRGAFGTAEHLAGMARVMALTNEARVAAQARAPGTHLNADALLAPDLLGEYRARVAGRAASRRGTTHMSVIDGAGSLASLTVSNGEGSGYVVPGTGVVLNNMLGEEDLNPGGFQRWPAAHRMTSMMAPSAVRWPDGRRIALGSGGSNRIRTAVLQVLSNLVDHGMTVEQAVLAPRVHHEGDLLSIEGGFDPERIRATLDEYPSHQLWHERNMFFGGAHAAEARGGSLAGIGDPRRAGACLIC